MNENPYKATTIIRWLRFTIRDLLFATVIVALAVSWWIDHWSLTHRPSTLIVESRTYLSAELQPGEALMIELRPEGSLDKRIVPSR